MIQVKTFHTARPDSVEDDVNKWLRSREVQKYQIFEIKFALAGEYGSYESILVVYDDDPKPVEQYSTTVPPVAKTS